MALAVPRLVQAIPASGPANGMPGLILTHDDGGTASVIAGTWNSTTFTLTNAGTAVVVNFVATVCDGALATCSVSPSSASLATGDVLTVTVSMKGGDVSGTGTITLAAKKASTGGTLASSGVAVTVTPSLRLSTAPHAGEFIDVSRCISDCFETTHSYTTPAYVSLDVPRSLTLLYRSGRAYPHGKLALDVTDLNPSVGSSYRLKLKDQNGAYVTFTNASTELYFTRANSGPTRIAAQFYAGSIPTSARNYTAEVTSYYPGGQETVPVGERIIVINGEQSPFGAGVDIAGLERISFDQTGGVLVTDGSGSASFYTGGCSPSFTCTFIAPAGELSSLSTLGNGTYRRVYPDGTTLTFNSAGLHTSTADRFGTTTQINWGQTTTGVTVPGHIIDPLGMEFTLWYRDAGSTYGTWKEGTLGNIHTASGLDAPMGVNFSNDLLSWCDVNATYAAQASYDGNHRLTQVIDKNGGYWNYTYRYSATPAYLDAPAVQIFDGSSPRARTAWRDPQDTLLYSASLALGTSSANAVPVLTLPARITDPGGHVAAFTLDRWNQPLAATDATNRTTTITRDSTGRPTAILYPTGVADTMRYSGNALVMVKPAGADSTIYSWSTRSFTPPGASAPITITVLDSAWGPRQAWQQIVYAANGVVQSVTSRYSQGDPTTFTTTLTTDSYGRVLTSQDNAGHLSKHFYNGRYGNLDSTVAPGGQYIKVVYDTAGRDSLHWMAGLPRPVPYTAGPIKYQTLYDKLNRVVSISDGMRPAVQYEWGVIFLNKVRDRAGQVFRRDYNFLGLVTAEYDPADTTSWSRYIRYEYDVDGQLKKQTNRRGQVITTTYDVLHRPTSVSSVSGTDNFGYSADGLRTAAWNSVSTDSSFFRSNGWQDSVVTRIAGQRFRTRYLPDSYQRLDSIDITGPSITFAGRKYVYDPTQNVLSTIRFGGSYGATINRNNEGMVNGITYLVNGTFRTRSLYFTTAHQLFRDEISSLYMPNPSGTGYYSGGYIQAYGYDSTGHIREQTPNPDMVTQVDLFNYSDSRLQRHFRFNAFPGQCPTADVNYGYDCGSLYPLVQNRPYDQAQYGHDNADNRVTDGRQGRDASAITYTANTNSSFDPGDRVKTDSGAGPYGSGDNIAPFAGNALTFERDLDGNLTRRYGTSTDIRYGWDAIGHLTSVTVAATGATVNYDYNAFGQLVRRRTSGTVDRHFLWEGDNLLAELDGAATSRIAEYVHWGLDQPLAVLTGTYTVGEVNYVIQDARGNVRVLFNQLPEARVNFLTDYTDQGTPVNTTWGVIENRLLFKGMLYEGDSTKLYYARNRWYSPEFGGFMSEDPLNIGGGLNTYAFAGGDPIDGSDPFGLSFCGSPGGRTVFGPGGRCGGMRPQGPQHKRRNFWDLLRGLALLGTKTNPSSCTEFRDLIRRRHREFLGDYRRYRKAFDNGGGSKGHFEEVFKRQTGLEDDLDEYDKRCRNDDDFGDYDEIRRRNLVAIPYPRSFGLFGMDINSIRGTVDALGESLGNGLGDLAKALDEARERGALALPGPLPGPGGVPVFGP